METPPTNPLSFLSPFWEETPKTSQGERQIEKSKREEMIENLKSYATKFEFSKVPLLVKPMEEAKVKLQGWKLQLQHK